MNIMNDTQSLKSSTDYADASLFTQSMDKLLKVVQELSASKDLKSMMDIVRHSVRLLTGSDGATFILRDGDMCYYAEENAIAPLWKGKKLPIDICLSGWVIKNRVPAVVEDIYNDSRTTIDPYKGTFVRSLAIVPIRTVDPIGAIGCYWAEKTQPTTEQIKTLQVIADTAAIAMDNINYRTEIAGKAALLESTVDGTLLAVAKMVEKRDLYTFGHQRRVAQIALAIASELGLPEDKCALVYRSSIVHDIGKISIPSELLVKPDKLTKVEYDYIKVHPVQGYEILKDVPLLLPVAEIALQHHERLDGSGYPYGLRGDEIKLEARIVCVADVFEAMNFHRPYRPALGPEAALQELTAHKGTLYDADAVDALVSLIRDKYYKIPE